MHLVHIYEVGTKVTLLLTWYTITLLACFKINKSLFFPRVSLPVLKRFNIFSFSFKGQCFVAIDPSVFAPGFEDRLSSLMNFCRTLDPVMTITNVLLLEGGGLGRW